MTNRTKAPATPRKRVDWEAVERDYRIGQLTLREMGDKHEVNHSAIARKAQRDGWVRDMSRAVREATRAALIQETAREEVTKLVTDKVNTGQRLLTDSVLMAAEAGTAVVLSHRKDARKARGIAAELMDELQEARMLARERELLAQILAGSGATPTDEAEARKVVHKALALSGRVRTLKDLAETLSKLQTMERQSFNLDEAPPEDGFEALLSRVLAHPQA